MATTNRTDGGDRALHPRPACALPVSISPPTTRFPQKNEIKSSSALSRRAPRTFARRHDGGCARDLSHPSARHSRPTAAAVVGLHCYPVSTAVSRPVLCATVKIQGTIVYNNMGAGTVQYKMRDRVHCVPREKKFNNTHPPPRGEKKTTDKSV